MFILALGGLSACVSVPKIGNRTTMQTPESVAASQVLGPRGTLSWPVDRWWQTLGDQQLTALIEEGLANAPQVAIAVARIQRAEAEAQRVGAARQLSINAEAEAAMRRQSANNGIPAQFLPSGWNDYAQTSFSLGYNFDVWGSNRAALAAATSELRAATIDAAQARLVLSVAITAAYAELGRAWRERDNAEDVLTNRRAMRDLVARRERNGLDSRSSLRQADAEVASAQQAFAASEEIIDVRRNQISALLGAGPDRGRALMRPPLSPSAPAGIPAGVTTDLLGRRPDIVAARERVESAASKLKLARAGFYPSISLRALIGLQALGIGNLSDSQSVYGAVGPAVSLPIFEGGALQGQYRGAAASYDEAAANYNQTVITAYQQVADALAQRDAVDRRLAAARDALSASKDALDMMRRRYEVGLASYLDVLAAERGVQTWQLAIIGLETNERGAALAMVRALGGGFDVDTFSSAGQTGP